MTHLPHPPSHPSPPFPTRTIRLTADDRLIHFLEGLMGRSIHRTWERYVAHRRRKDAATKAHNTRVYRHIAIYEQICAKLEEWNDGLRLEELAVMLGEDELKVYRTLRWAERAEWLVNEGEKGWRRVKGNER